MKNDVIADEFSILKDTLTKNWYKFSNKKQVVKIYSKLSQSGFMNLAKKYFESVDHINMPMEKIDNLNKVIQNEISNYDQSVDTYLIISVVKDQYKTDSVDRH
jgi:hypothetical protein